MEESHHEAGDAAETLAAVGASVRRIRMAREISVAELARTAGVSRRMLTAIETGTANTSLVTLDKLARVLGVTLAELVRPQSNDPLEIVGPEQAAIMWSGAGASAGRLFTQTSGRGTAELWDWTLSPGDRYPALPDPPGSEEIMLVLSGTLTLEVEGERYRVQPGTVARLASDRSYAYVNETDKTVTFARVVVLSE